MEVLPLGRDYLFGMLAVIVMAPTIDACMLVNKQLGVTLRWLDQDPGLRLAS
jgi:hypothetical protein